MKPLFSSVLIAGLFVAFLLIAAGGIGLTLLSMESGASQAATQNNPSSKLNVNVNQSGVKFEITTAIPGLVIFAFGGVGLILLLVKVPVRQVRYQSRRRAPPSTTSFLTAPTFEVPSVVVSDRVERIPLLLWWFVRGKGKAVRSPE